jgi:hypothetical protein
VSFGYVLHNPCFCMFTSVLFAISFTRPIVCHMLVQWHFKCPAERRDEANRVLELNFQNRMTQMLYQEKKKATKTLYTDGKEPAEELDEEGNRWPTEQALVSANPEKIMNREGWRLLCAHWSTPEFRKKPLLASRDRLARGPAVYHHCGSRSLPASNKLTSSLFGSMQNQIVRTQLILERNHYLPAGID